MKVLLINPPVNSPYPVMPLGLAYLAAALEECHIPVEVIDAWAEKLSFEDIGRETARRQPDLVGITMLTPTYAAAARTVQAVRSHSGARIVVGGAHASALPEEVLQENPGIDYAAVGEGERTLVSLAAALEKKDPDVSRIPGLFYRAGASIVNTGPADPVGDLDKIPFPARHLFPLSRYRTHLPYGRRRPYMTLITGRGCPFQCTYCSKAVFGSRYRIMSAGRVVEEIRHMVETCKVRELHFYDDDFTIDMPRAGAICDELIRRNIRLDWSCTTRVDFVDEELLKKMKRAGCSLISYGVESGNAEVLKNAQKGYTLEDVRKAFGITRRLGIRTLAFFMFGLPGETPETVQETMKLSLELDPDFVSWAVVTLLPGSPLYERTMKEGFGKAPAFTDITQKQAAHPYSAGETYAIYEGALSKDQLLQYSNEAHRMFYFRPGYLFRSLLNIRSPGEFAAYARIGLQLFASITAKQPS